MSQAFRNLALDLLDDEHGVNKTAWMPLADMLDDHGSADIVEAISVKGGRFRLSGATVAKLRAVLFDEDDDEDDDGILGDDEDDEDD